MFIPTAKRSANVRLEMMDDWAEIRVGKDVKFSLIKEHIRDDVQDFYANEFLKLAETLAANRGEKLEHFDSGYTSWFGIDTANETESCCDELGYCEHSSANWNNTKPTWK